MTSTTDEWITLRQGANTLGVSVQRMRALVKEGKIPHRKLPYGHLPDALHVSKKACQDRKSSLHPPTEAP